MDARFADSAATHRRGRASRGRRGPIAAARRTWEDALMHGRAEVRLRRARRVVVLAVVAASSVAGCTHAPPPVPGFGGSAGTASQTASVTPLPTLPWPGPATAGGPITAGLIPLPVLARTDPGESFTLSSRTRIWIGTDQAAQPIAETLAAALRPATGLPLPVDRSVDPPPDSFLLAIDQSEPQLGEEGYDLTVTRRAVILRARTPAGLFYGVQTIRQLLPQRIEATSVQPGSWEIPGGRIVDYPRFAYRGAMLDVARHFFTVAQVERYIDELARYKVNVLHLHLSDDQGWRIAIDGWPKLTSIGGKTAVGGGPGGYYTQAEYRAIVAYAQARFITIVPEIDTPGHVNAALVSYPALACPGTRLAPYTGTGVGFSTLCVDQPVVFQFLNDVVAQLAALTPGPYLHLGGDEAASTKPADYLRYVEQAQKIVTAHGKTMMGWAEIAAAPLDRSTVAEYWNFRDRGATARKALDQGVRLVAAPADHAYVDQKYDPSTPLGVTWAGPTSVEKAYSWDPTDIAPEDRLLGVEGPLWSETISSLSQVEFLAWPRMAGIAEIGWTPRAERSWSTYRLRLAAQAPRWEIEGVNFYRSPEVPWVSASAATNPS